MSVANVNLTIQGPGPRLKIFWLRESLALFMLRGLAELPEFCSLAKIEGLPEDAVIERIFYAPERLAFGVTVFSRTFEPVTPGTQLPYVDHELQFERHNLRFVRGVHHSFAGLSRDELLRIRDDLNAALYDLEKRPM